MSHWAVNDGKMKICERKDAHLWTERRTSVDGTYTKLQNDAQKELGQNDIQQSQQTDKDFTQTHR